MRSFSAAMLAVALLRATNALGHEHPGEVDSARPPEAVEPVSQHLASHPEHVIAIVGVYAAGFPKGEDVIHHGGGGLAFHTGLIPEWLEIEIALKAVFAAEHQHFPFEIALKVPFHLTESMFLSPGLGPMVALHVHGSEVGVA